MNTAKMIVVLANKTGYTVEYDAENQPSLREHAKEMC